MAPIAARDARAVPALVEEVIAIDLLALCQVLELRGIDQAAPATPAVHHKVRQEAPPVHDDRAMHTDIAALLRLIRADELPACGPP